MCRKKQLEACVKSYRHGDQVQNNHQDHQAHKWVQTTPASNTNLFSFTLTLAMGLQNDRGKKVAKRNAQSRYLCIG